MPTDTATPAKATTARTKPEANKKPKATPRKQYKPRATFANGLSSTAVAKKLGVYLDECRTLGLTGKGGIQAMGGRPTEAIQKSIEKHEARLRESKTLIGELRERSALLDLRRVLALRGDGSPSEAQQFFVAHAAEWATINKISHGAFRDMGVPASVLKEAGIHA